MVMVDQTCLTNSCH